MINDGAGDNLCVFASSSVNGDALLTSCTAGTSNQQLVPTPAPLNSVFIRQSGSGLCVADVVAVVGASLSLATCIWGSGRSFDIVPWPAGGALLTLQDQSVCAYVQNGSTANGALIVVAACNPSTSYQRMVIGSNGDGSYGIRTQASRCWDTAYGGTSPGSHLVQGTCTGSKTQIFYLDGRTAASAQVLQASGSSWCINVIGASTSSALQMLTCEPFGDRAFYADRVNGNQVKLSLPNHLCLRGSGTHPGDPVTVEACTADTSTTGGQVWMALMNHDSSYTFMNTAGNQCIDAASGSTAKGSAVVVGPCTYSGTQKFLVALPV
jgi:hypothetical protein